MSRQYFFTFKGFFTRCRQEYQYFTSRPWTIQQVGAFWDTVTEYDEVNKELYPHEKRFSNSFTLAAPFLTRSDYTMLDIQTRSGKPSLFWHEKSKLRSSTCVDFSDHLVSLAKKRLANSGLAHNIVKIKTLPLPFQHDTFNLVCSYETIEHIYDYAAFIQELTRVMTKDGLMIITCPNVNWEWVHWLSAAININHSEGPHRFLHRGELKRSFDQNGLKILAENTTIFLPFNHPVSIKIDEWLEKHLPESIKRCLGLRRTFILTRK